MPNGMVVGPDGILHLPNDCKLLTDGTMVDRTGAAVPQAADGGWDMPDGSRLSPDGKVTLPNGDVIHLDGSYFSPALGVTMPPGGSMFPDGTGKLLNSMTLRPDGVVALPDGSFKLPDGRVQLPDASFAPQNADGSWLLPDGTLMPDGTFKMNDGAILRPDGICILPDQSIVLRDGTTKPPGFPLPQVSCPGFEPKPMGLPELMDMQTTSFKRRKSGNSSSAVSRASGQSLLSLSSVGSRPEAVSPEYVTLTTTTKKYTPGSKTVSEVITKRRLPGRISEVPGSTERASPLPLPATLGLTPRLLLHP